MVRLGLAVRGVVGRAVEVRHGRMRQDEAWFGSRGGAWHGWRGTVRFGRQDFPPKREFPFRDWYIARVAEIRGCN